MHQSTFKYYRCVLMLWEGARLPEPCQFTAYCKNTLKLAAVPSHLLSLSGISISSPVSTSGHNMQWSSTCCSLSLMGICKGWGVDTGAQSPPAHCLSQMYTDRNMKLSQNTDVWLCCHCLTLALYFLYHVCWIESFFLGLDLGSSCYCISS